MYHTFIVENTYFTLKNLLLVDFNGKKLQNMKNNIDDVIMTSSMGVVGQNLV